MAQFSLGYGSKIFSLVIGSLLLTGCYKIEMKETLNIDGTSKIAVKLDMSEAQSSSQSFSETQALEAASTILEAEITNDTFTEAVTYDSCGDPDLVAKYGAESLEGPETIVSTIDVIKSTSCTVSETEGMVKIQVDNIDSANEEVLFSQTIERRSDSCDAPALLSFYRIEDFSEPITETYSLEKTLDISCSDIRGTIAVTTITAFEGQDIAQPVIENFEITEPAFIPDNTLAELEALTLSAEEIEVKQMAESVAVCQDLEQNPEDLPLFFTKCENSAPGVGDFHYSKYDTTGLKINANGTVTYNLELVTQPLKNAFDAALEADETLPAGSDLASYGFVLDYILVSPWPIVEHSVGELEDQYTLRVDLLKTEAEQSLSVTFDADGGTLDLISPRTQLQIDQLIASLQERLESAEAPKERQIEYIHHLSGKIQRLAAMKPTQQVPLGYLQTKLINLAERLDKDPIEDLEAEFLKELASLEAEVFNEAEGEDVFAEAEAQAQINAEASVMTETEEVPTAVEEEPTAEVDQEEALLGSDETSSTSEETQVLEEAPPEESAPETSLLDSLLGGQEEENFEEEEKEEAESFDDEDEEESFEDDEDADMAIILE
jgi:hypothetical protein